jgi:hypothetical protein
MHELLAITGLRKRAAASSCSLLFLAAFFVLSQCGGPLASVSLGSSPAKEQSRMSSEELVIFARFHAIEGNMRPLQRSFGIQWRASDLSRVAFRSRLTDRYEMSACFGCMHAGLTRRHSTSMPHFRQPISSWTVHSASSITRLMLRALELSNRYGAAICHAGAEDMM